MMYLCESSSSSYPHSSCRPHIYNIQVDRCRSKSRGCWHICTDTETQRNCTHPSLHEARNRINTYQKRTSAPTVFSVQAQPSPPQYVWVKSACFARCQSCSLLFLNCVDLACDKLELVSYSTPALCDPPAKQTFLFCSIHLCHTTFCSFLQKCISVSGSLPTQLFTLLQR